MHGFVTARGPTGPSGQARRVILPANENPSRCRLLLEMTFQAQGRIAFLEHPGIHRPVDRVAGRATLAHRFVLENERTALSRVTPATSVEFRGQGGAAADDCAALVRIMAVAATDLAFEDRMMMREIELAALVQVALETGLG